jgi:hypothetical protein
MNRGLIGGAALLAGLAAIPSALATSPPIAIAPVDGPAAKTPTASVVPARAGAAATLRLTVPTVVRCGRLRTPVSVALPSVASVPGAIARTAVTIDGRAARSVQVHGHTIRIAPAVSPGAACDAVLVKPVTIRLGRTAGVRNPSSSGRYVVRVRIGLASYEAPLRITA